MDRLIQFISLIAFLFAMRKQIPVISFVMVMLLFPVRAFTWGFYAHRCINRLAVFTLPPGMFGFFKKNIDYLESHATDPDSRRYIVEGEAPRHYIDLDRYSPAWIDELPMKWDYASGKYSEDSLLKNGTVPWQVELMMNSLTRAFRDYDAERILSLSSNIGHYIADAHVPLHTTQNYNGQLTGQTGIHGFWESRIPELFSEDWDLLTGQAVYIENASSTIWDIVLESFWEKDSVFTTESDLTNSWGADRKYIFDNRKKMVTREFSKAYHERTHQMVLRKMKKAIFSVGSFWMTAWIDAGSPDLDKLGDKPFRDSVENVLLQESLRRELIRQPEGHED